MDPVFAKQIEDKFAFFENQIANLRKDLEVKDKQLNAVDLRLEEVEKEHKAYKKTQDKKIKDLENACKQKKRKENESEATIPKCGDLKCGKCDYTTTSKQGLKIHNSKVHSKINFEEFPAACDICEKVLQNENDLKKHKKSQHTNHSVRYQCNECEFMANEEETLHVHFGRNHSDEKQCGLCDKIFDTSINLDDHLSKCEIFMCSNSGCRETYENLTDMKEHIQNEHRKNSPAHYTFSYWLIHSKDKSENEINKKRHTINPQDW